MNEVIEPGVGRVEFGTIIRGRPVACWIENGRLGGDAVLLDRLSRFTDLAQRLEPVRVAQLVRDAVGSDVTIRVGPEPRSEGFGS
jgi:hypothetical protein